MTRPLLVLALWALPSGCAPAFQPDLPPLSSTPESPTPKRYAPPAAWILGPIYGTVCPLGVPCQAFAGATMRDEVNYILDNLSLYDIPISAFHFDGNKWATGSCDWDLGDPLIERLRGNRQRALLHYWGGCTTTADFDRLYAKLGNVLGGLYLDDTYFGLIADDAMAKLATDWMQARLPRVGEVVMKNYNNGVMTSTTAGLAAYAHTAYVNDLTSDAAGMRIGIQRVFESSALFPAPINEFTAYDYTGGRADEEIYFRRLHFGALQVVMDHSPNANADPWAHGYDPILLTMFKYYSWLHHELVPYLHSYDFLAYETGQPILRDRNPQDLSTKIGDELFVRYIAEVGVKTVPVDLPEGEWIDYWDESRLFRGPVSISLYAPPGREPIFIRNGALIPLRVSRAYTGHGTSESADSLTLLVYPHGGSSFQYHDEERRRWFPFAAQSEGDRLALRAASDFGQPLLYRVARWPISPRRVSQRGASILINSDDGDPLPQLSSEPAVNGSRGSAWFYDERAARVIIKHSPP